MSAYSDDFLSQNAKVDEASVQPFPNSRKVYVQGSQQDIRVPMREISLSDTPTDLGGEKNPPVYVYDTSGAYTDPNATIDVRAGLAAIRQGWIERRADTETLADLSSSYGQRRKNDPMLANLRFDHLRKPIKAKSGSNVSQMHYARKGIITDEMEFVAIRENMKLQDARATGVMLQQHPGQPFGAKIPDEITPEFVRQELAAGRAVIPGA
jgi:phosphomethylpyrimidine synthase